MADIAKSRSAKWVPPRPAAQTENDLKCVLDACETRESLQLSYKRLAALAAVVHELEKITQNAAACHLSCSAASDRSDEVFSEMMDIAKTIAATTPRSIDELLAKIRATLLFVRVDGARVERSGRMMHSALADTEALLAGMPANSATGFATGRTETERDAMV